VVDTVAADMGWGGAAQMCSMIAGSVAFVPSPYVELTNHHYLSVLLPLPLLLLLFIVT
jgi:hypothetical protein